MPPEPIEVFFSYAHQDEAFKDELVKHLINLQRQGFISTWHDRKIVPGIDWGQEIDRHLETSGIILLLVSADFLASDYCWEVEVQKAMQRHHAKEARVIPIVLRSVDWEATPFARLQALPKDTRPIANWTNRDDAFLDVARGIRTTVEDLRSGQSPRQAKPPVASARTQMNSTLSRTPAKKPGWLTPLVWVSVAGAVVFGIFSAMSQNRPLPVNSLPESPTPSPSPSVAQPTPESPTPSPSPSVAQPTAEDLFKRGREKAEKGDHSGAIADYDEAIKLKPDFARAYNARGISRAALGDYQSAIADYDQAIQINRNWGEIGLYAAYWNRGNVRFNLGDKQAAIADYTQAIKLKPDLAEAYSSRGDAHSDLGDKQTAIADHTQAIKLKPDLAEAYNGRGNAHRALGNNQAALTDYDASLRLKHPEPWRVFNDRGNAHRALGDDQGAISDYTQAIQLKPDLAEAYYNRGLIYGKQGEKQQAIADFQKAADLHQQQGNSNKRQDALNRLKELQP